MEIIEQKYNCDTEVYCVPGILLHNSIQIKDLTEIPTDSMGRLVVLDSDLPETDIIQNLLCDGHQILVPDSSNNIPYLNCKGCHVYRDMVHLKEVIHSVRNEILNLTFETRFFNRGKYKTKNELVTVIIATHKDWDVLDRSLESLVKQSYQNYEVIIVNDDPSRKSREEVEKCAGQFTDRMTIKIIHNNKNVFQYVSRNAGISFALGEYITFLDTGDIFLNGRLEELKKNISAEKQVVNSMYIRLKSPKDEKGEKKFCCMLFCPRKIYEMYGFFDNVKAAADSAFLEGIPKKIKKELSSVSYHAIGSNMSNKFKNSRMEYFRNRQKHAAKNPKYYNRPFSKKKPYQIPQELLVLV